MHSDLIEILRVFNLYKVDYLIIGGYAVIFHAEPRFTKGLDIFVRASQENARRVFQSLRAFGAPLRGLTEKDFEQEGYWYQIGVSPIRVGVLTAIDGVKFEDAWARRVESTIGNVRAPFISKEDLIITKKATGRPRDLLDVDALLASQSNKKPKE